MIRDIDDLIKELGEQMVDGKKVTQLDLIRVLKMLRAIVRKG